MNGRLIYLKNFFYDIFLEEVNDRIDTMLKGQLKGRSVVHLD
jgi:hypothetical protein